MNEKLTVPVFLGKYRFHGAHVSGWVYVLLRHATTKSATDGYRTRQIEIQVRVETAGDRLAVGDAGRAGDISHVQLMGPIFGIWRVWPISVWDN